MKKHLTIFITALICGVLVQSSYATPYGFSVIQEDVWMSSNKGDDSLNYHLSEFNPATDTLISAIFTFDIEDDIPSIGPELEDEGATIYMIFGSFFDIVKSFYISEPTQKYSINLTPYLISGWNESSDLIEFMFDTSGYHQDNGGEPDIFPDFTIKTATLSYAVERVEPVPEPSAILLFALGLTGVLGKRSRSTSPDNG